eukprot:s1097_g3.t1
MARRADKESSSDSEQEWRLEGHEHLREQYAATMNLLLVPAAEVKKKGETRRKQRPRQEGAVRKGGRRPRAGKRRGPRRPQRVEAAEKAKKGSEPTEAAEAKGRAHGERRERREGSTEPQKAKKGSEPTPAEGQSAPEGRQGQESGAQAREGKKMGYLVKAINHAMRRKAEEQSRPPVRRGAGAAKDATWSCDQDRGWFRVASAATS